MKRIAVLLLLLLVVQCLFASCTAKYAPDETENTGDETVMHPAEQSAANPISMRKYFRQQSEWDGEILLAVSEYSSVVLTDESAREYPELAAMLEQTRNLTLRAMEGEYDNLLADAKENLARLGADRFVTGVSTLDVQIRRADSTAVSLLSDSYLVYGKIDARGLHGTTYDTATGRQLMLADVIRDMSRIPAIVKKELTSHSWKGDFLSGTAVEDYFRDTPADGLAWTLDYNGVTFYFGSGDVAELGDGRLAATVSFAEYPDLFAPEYTAIPDAYMVELPLDHPLCTDLDGDGAPEELTLTPVTHESGLYYEAFAVYTDTDAAYFRSELSADIAYRTGGYHPYYVKTADGRHYLYVFAEGSELAAGDMKLRVIDITGGKCREVGDTAAAPGCIPVDFSWALTDPDHMMLENFALMEEAAPYRVGEDGMPVRK